jgi:CheY-like chemotaxis protein
MSYLEGKTILVVDDEAAIRELFLNEFMGQGCVCFEADSGEKAFEIYQQQKFDAIVSDIRMPNGDGMFLLKKIAEMGRSESFMVFITGYSDIPADEFYKNGADLIVQKPFEVDVIVKMIEDSLQAPRSQWRQMARVNTNLAIELSWPDRLEPIRATTHNVSRRGFFIQCGTIFPTENSVVDFKLSLKTPMGQRYFCGKIIVRWVRREGSLELPSGFGAEFIGPDERVMDELAELVGLDYLFSA